MSKSLNGADAAGQEPHFENHLIRWSKVFIMSNILIFP